MKKILFALVFIIAANTFAAHGQTKNDDILKLLTISGTDKIAEQTMHLMIPQFKQLIPNIPDAFWNRFMAKLDINSLLLGCVPVYNKYYTHDEIKQLIAFYETPLGRRMVEITPLVNQETMIIGQNWGEKLGHDIVNELIREGYLED